MNDTKSYWKESVESSLEEHGVAATTNQIEQIAGDMQISQDQFGMAFGHDVADRNLRGSKDSEIADLHRKLQREKDKVHCKTCNGLGRIIEHGPCHSSESECYKCHGEGRL